MELLIPLFGVGWSGRCWCWGFESYFFKSDISTVEGRRLENYPSCVKFEVWIWRVLKFLGWNTGSFTKKRIIKAIKQKGFWKYTF